MKCPPLQQLLCLFGILHRAGLTVMIHTEKTVMARLGEEAQFRCQLLTPTDVFKITWHKILPDGEKRIIASHDKYFGQRVEPEFSSRVEFQDTGLQSSSLVFKQVEQEDVGCYHCSFITYPEGVFTETACLELYANQTVVIHTEQTVMARLGEEAQLRCLMLTHTNVIQVTWLQRLTAEEKVIALDGMDFDARVEPEFSTTVEFRDSKLQNSSIVIRNVTEKHVGCYRCSFISYPEGTHSETTCLKLYELHGPFLHYRESDFPKEATIYCSATGQPAPTVSIKSLRHKVRPSTHSSNNKNKTVTIIATAVLPLSYEYNTQVECTAEIPFVPQRKAFVKIPKSKTISAADGSDKKSGSYFPGYSNAVIVSVVFFCVLSFIWICCKRKT